MTRRTNRLTGMIAAALVATALAPVAAVAQSGGGANGQHIPPPAQQELVGGGAYGQHLPSATPVSEVQSTPASSDDSSSGFGLEEAVVVGGSVLLAALLGMTVYTRRRAGRTPAVSS